MKITKGTLVTVHHIRKGTFKAIAEEDFDTDTTTWYPLQTMEPVLGISQDPGNRKWAPGQAIPCRNSLCQLEIEEVK